MAALRIGALHDDPLVASAWFHTHHLPQVVKVLDGGEPVLTLVFEPADHAHRDWRRAIIATLAREKAPARINALASDDEAAIAAALAWIEAAPGITGQCLTLDGEGAGPVIG